jgi:hypothetical protein
MKIWKLAIVVLAVGMFSMSAIAGDDCTSATDVATDLDPCADGTPNGPLGQCTSGDGLFDVWWKFTAGDATARVRTDLGSAGTDSDYVVYEGTCASLTPIGCSEDEAAYLGDISVKGLTNGDTYYIRLGGWSDSCGPFHATVTMPDDSGRVCGDGTVNVSNEECDGDGAACDSGECAADCTCVPPTPALPVWGLIGLGVLLLGGGATALRRRRK